MRLATSCCAPFHGRSIRTETWPWEDASSKGMRARCLGIRQSLTRSHLAHIYVS